MTDLSPWHPPATSPRLSPSARSAVATHIHEMVDALLARYGPKSQWVADPLAAVGKAQRPFLFALSPTFAKAFALERSFSTSLGNLMAKSASVICAANGLSAEVDRTVTGRVDPQVLTYIDSITRKGSGKRPKPDLASQLATMKTLNAGPMIPHEVEMDLFINTPFGDEFYFDLKTPSPNADQPREMKQRLMRCRALRLPLQTHTFGVFYYNPNGTTRPFRTGASVLDYSTEVLVGKAFWDYLGGAGTYEELLDVYTQTGASRAGDFKQLV